MKIKGISLGCGCEFHHHGGELYTMMQCSLHRAAPDLLIACDVMIADWDKRPNRKASKFEKQVRAAAIKAKQ